MIGHQLCGAVAGVPAAKKADWLTGLDVPPFREFSDCPTFENSSPRRAERDFPRCTTRAARYGLREIYAARKAAAALCTGPRPRPPPRHSRSRYPHGPRLRPRLAFAATSDHGEPLPPPRSASLLSAPSDVTLRRPTRRRAVRLFGVYLPASASPRRRWRRPTRSRPRCLAVSPRLARSPPLPRASSPSPGAFPPPRLPSRRPPVSPTPVGPPLLASLLPVARCLEVSLRDHDAEPTSST